jgi:hypothetical protein
VESVPSRQLFGSLLSMIIILEYTKEKVAWVESIVVAGVPVCLSCEEIDKM